MELNTIIYFCVVLFAAYLVRGIAGFGSALVAVPLLTVQLPITLVVPLVVSLDYLGSASQGLKHRKQIAWADLLPLIPFTLAGIVIALFALHNLDKAFLSQALGIFVIAYAIYQLLPLPELRGSRLASLPYGFLGGFVGTTFATGGPFYVIYLNMRGLAKDAFRASYAIYFLVDGTMRLAGYTIAGLYNLETLLFLLAALPFASLGLYFGGRIHTNLSRRTFVRIISVILLSSGIALLLKY